MKVLITGASGFIGGHLANELSNHGHEVVGLDIVRGKAPEAWRDHAVWCDVSVPGQFSDHLDYFRPDAVAHLAAQVGRERGEDDLYRTVAWNAAGTTMVAHACGTRGVPVLYTSSSEVYGDLGIQVAHEYGQKNLPHNLYGLSKRWGEEALELYAPDRLMIARLSMPYGPGAPPGRGRRAMDNFLWQANHSMPITVHRGAERSWCWVGDTVRALRYMLEAGERGIWNVGRDDDPRSMYELAWMACDIAGRSPSEASVLVQEVDPPSMQTVVKRLSTGQLREDFGWEPTVELEDGMRHLWEWIRRFDREGNLDG